MVMMVVGQPRLDFFLFLFAEVLPVGWLPGSKGAADEKCASQHLPILRFPWQQLNKTCSAEFGATRCGAGRLPTIVVPHVCAAKPEGPCSAVNCLFGQQLREAG